MALALCHCSWMWNDGTMYHPFDNLGKCDIHGHCLANGWQCVCDSIKIWFCWQSKRFWRIWLTIWSTIGTWPDFVWLLWYLGWNSKWSRYGNVENRHCHWHGREDKNEWKNMSWGHDLPTTGTHLGQCFSDRDNEDSDFKGIFNWCLLHLFYSTNYFL